MDPIYLAQITSLNTQKKMFVVVIFKQNLKVCFHFPFWWRHVLNILNHHPPSTVSLLWARDGEEVCKNKTLPSIQYSVSPGNMSQHWIIIACNIMEKHASYLLSWCVVFSVSFQGLLVCHSSFPVFANSKCDNAIFSGRFSKGVAEFEIEHPYFKVYKKQYAKRVV